MTQMTIILCRTSLSPTYRGKDAYAQALQEDPDPCRWLGPHPCGSLLEAQQPDPEEVEK